MSRIQEEWFGEWFDSPYYHLLYKYRDINEAKPFLDNICNYLMPDRTDLVLDLACGKGRHAIYLNEKGLEVIGVDLSEKNIKEAKRYENERLHFYVHDMRRVFMEDTFDYIMNFFTSFGYFDTKKENQSVVDAVARGLKKGGRFLLDFLNPYVVIHQLDNEEERKIGKVKFHLSKELSDEGYIIKNIDIRDNSNEYHFQEKVKAIRRIEFMEYFKNAGLRLVEIFGDYDLNPYIAEQSERLIFLVEK